MSEYKKVLFAWATEWLEPGAIVTDVRFEHNEGYWYSELTNQPAYDEIHIYYKVLHNSKWVNGVRTLDPEDMPFSELITQLFTIAERDHGNES